MIPPKDYTKRTSHMYDDRDGDVVTSLGQPVIKTCDGTTPKMVFFLVPSVEDASAASLTINLELEGYTRMADLSDETKALVRRDLGMPKLDPPRDLLAKKV